MACQRPHLRLENIRQFDKATEQKSVDQLVALKKTTAATGLMPHYHLRFKYKRQNVGPSPVGASACPLEIGESCIFSLQFKLFVIDCEASFNAD